MDRKEKSRIHCKLLGALFALLTGAAAGIASREALGTLANPVRVVATIPDLGSLVHEIGSDAVAVTVVAKGREDPHFAEPKPSLVKLLSEADLFVQAGMNLEVGYAPVLLQSARNARVLPGNPGYVDASAAVTPLEVPAGPVDRSMGDIHPSGNPHYLLDPLNGLAVAALLRDRLSALRPEEASRFARQYQAFEDKLAAALVGPKLAAKYDARKLALLHEHGRLGEFLEQQGERGDLEGWLGALLPYYGAKVVDDHNLWPYFARRFGIRVVGHLEPKPGIPPTTRHLSEIIEQMRSQGVRVILAAPYYDPRHAHFVAAATGARIAYLSHQTGGREGVDDYLNMIDYNVRALATALAGAAGTQTPP